MFAITQSLACLGLVTLPTIFISVSFHLVAMFHHRPKVTARVVLMAVFNFASRPSLACKLQCHIEYSITQLVPVLKFSVPYNYPMHM